MTDRPLTVLAQTKALNVTDVSANVQIGRPTGTRDEQVMIQNLSSANDVWIELGTSGAQTAVRPVSGGAAGGFNLAPRATIILTAKNDQDYVAAICATGLTATINVTRVVGF